MIRTNKLKNGYLVYSDDSDVPLWKVVDYNPNTEKCRLGILKDGEIDGFAHGEYNLYTIKKFGYVVTNEIRNWRSEISP